MNETERDAFTPAEFARRCGIGRTKVFAEIKDGRLIARKVGKRTIITAGEGRAWLESLPKAGEAVAA